MFRSHMTAGLVTAVAVVLLCVTGAAITYRGVTRAALDASQIGDVGFRESPYYIASDWQTWLRLARQEIDGDLTVVAFPRTRGGQVTPPDFEYGTVDPAAAVQFRFVTAGDWLGMAGSRVYIDPRQSALVGTARFDDLPFGQRLYSLIVPLHTGRNVSPAYLAVLLLCTALVTVMTFSGVFSFVLKLLRGRSRKSSPLEAGTPKQRTTAQRWAPPHMAWKPQRERPDERRRRMVRRRTPTGSIDNATRPPNPRHA